jgi:hemoglobin
VAEIGAAQNARGGLAPWRGFDTMRNQSIRGTTILAQSMYEKYGGFASVSRIVLDFYDKVLDSEEVGDFFDDVDMKRLIDHQTKFISFVMGGPIEYANDRLEQLHQRRDISNADFDEIKQLLSDTLSEHGVKTPDRETVLEAIEVRRRLIVS